MLFTLIDDRDAWLKFFEYFDLEQKITSATHIEIERLANMLANKFYNVSTFALTSELYEYGNAGYNIRFTIDDVECEVYIYADGSEVVDDAFAEYFAPGDTDCVTTVGMTISLTFYDAETNNTLLDLGEIKSKNK